MVPITIGEKIQALRKTKGMSQEQLAERLGVTRQAVSKWETGESLPDTDKILALGRVFGVTADSLLDEEVDPTAPPPPPPQPNATARGVWGLVKRKGYIAGYIISGYAALGFAVARLAHFAFSKMLPPEEFFLGAGELPAAFCVPLYLTDAISIGAAAVFVLGIILAVYWKKKGNK